MATGEKSGDGDEPLLTIGGVRRELAAVYRQVKAKTLDAKDGYTMAAILNLLLGAHQDVRDSRYKREVRELHDLLVKKKQPEAAAEH